MPASFRRLIAAALDEEIHIGLHFLTKLRICFFGSTRFLFPSNLHQGMHQPKSHESLNEFFDTAVFWRGTLGFDKVNRLWRMHKEQIECCKDLRRAIH